MNHSSALCRRLAAAWVVAVPVAVAAQSAALVVGIGAARQPVDSATWTSDIRRSARVDAETAFRELVPAARSETHLYSRPPRWEGGAGSQFDVATLLTDGVTDNQAIPTGPRIRQACSELTSRVDPNDDCMLFLTGIGEVNGMETWVYDRLGATIVLSSVLASAFPPGAAGRRIAVVRVYGAIDQPAAQTLYLADPATADRFEAWLATAERNIAAGDPPPDATDFMPGLGDLMATVTPIRIQRLRDRVRAASSTVGPWVIRDLGRDLERADQEIRAGVAVAERPVFKKVRRPGPLFTIVEVETDIQIGVETTVDSTGLARKLADRQLAAPAIDRILGALEARAANSFDEDLMVGRVQYNLRYDRTVGEVRIAYRD